MSLEEKLKDNRDIKTALITGATSGIGAAFAKRLAHDGYNLIVTGRRKDKITALANELSEAYHVNVEVIIVELSDIVELEALVERIMNQHIDILINNAGFGINRYFCEEDPGIQEKMVHVHIICPMRLIHAVLPNMISKGNGAIINVSSIGAFLSIPKNTIYLGTKAFLRAFTESLHIELMGTGVKVQVLCPGLVRTDFHEKLGISKAEQKNKGLVRWRSPEEIVDISIKGLKKNEVVCIPGWSTRIRTFLLSILPGRIYYGLIHNFFSK
ncbi:MAG: NAD(P)-dependent oxidoreductase [Anaerolinea sp.]|nr:NAD(P)-dependent oxidoreductase [Anaerolinea sp.]